MQLQNVKLTDAAIYVVVVAVIGLDAGITSAPGWVVLGGLALLPAIAVLSWRSHPPQTLSQAIQAARR